MTNMTTAVNCESCGVELANYEIEKKYIADGPDDFEVVAVCKEGCGAPKVTQEEANKL